MNFIKSKAKWIRLTSDAWQPGFIANGMHSGLGFDFYDVHVYSDTGTIDQQAGVCARAASDGVPVIVGEYGQGSQNQEDRLQLAVTNAVLSSAKSSCFTGALAWRYEGWAPYNYADEAGTPRPSVSAIQALAGTSYVDSWRGQLYITRCGNIAADNLSGYWPQEGSPGCYSNALGAATSPKCRIDSFFWKGAVYKERSHCGVPTETGFYKNGTRDGYPLYQKGVWIP